MKPITAIHDGEHVGILYFGVQGENIGAVYTNDEGILDVDLLETFTLVSNGYIEALKTANQ